MHNEPALIKRQNALLSQAKTLITTYEQGIAKLKSTQDRERAAAKQRYDYRVGELSKREQEVEQWKELVEHSSKKKLLNGGTAQELSFPTQSPLQRIDASLEVAKEQLQTLEHSMQAKSRPPLVILLFSFAIICLITMFISIIMLNTLNTSPSSLGVEATNATAVAAFATATAYNVTYANALATSGAANGSDSTSATARAANNRAASIYAQKATYYYIAQQDGAIANATVNARNYTIYIFLSLILSILFFIFALVVRYRIRHQMQTNWRNQYATISFALVSATLMLQKLCSEVQVDYDGQLKESRQQANKRYEKLQQMLTDGFAHLNKEITEYIQATGLAGANWQDVSQQVTMPSASPNVIRCGKITIAYEKQQTPTFPFFISFPAGQSLLLQASGISYEQAAMFLQSLLLRLVTTQPPGMVRFTFFDPKDFGKYITPFKQLSNYDTALVDREKGTGENHIRQQLESLSEYLAQVNEVLRGTPTIEEYNQQNPQNPLPYRMLVVQGFPDKFSLAKVQTLFNIARNGPRCGVYAIILCDMEQLALTSITLDNLNQVVLTLRWEGKQVHWNGI